MRAMRRLLVTLVVAVTLGVPTVSADAVSPITPANRPTPIPGAVNGEVPATHLIGVIPNCVAERNAAPSLMRLFTMAREANVSLGADECYRSLAEEVRLANI